jgi:hypothetical protein
LWAREKKTGDHAQSSRLCGFHHYRREERMNMSTYKALFRRYREHPREEVFSHFGWNGTAGETWETPFERLAKLAKKEEWNFTTPSFKRAGQDFPILMSYLNHTFIRAQDQGKIAYSNDDKACFNTGLQTAEEKDIFATFFRNKAAAEHNAPDWTLFGFADSYSKVLTPFPEPPDIPTYIDDASALVFDVHCDIEVNIAHIVDHHQERLPSCIQGNRTLAIAALEGATKFLRQRVLRNYKIAIPHWYEGRIQLLLPLCITNDAQADLALVADRDKGRNLYRITTVLTMDMAYIDARLICRPDREWLNP